jgi:demethylmenaquinone methyltransferase/2-methoxy-6-polyprenyl-1,4-benzoquinol methylase
MRVLDLATGTGLVAREALRIIGPDGRLVGLDPSAGMLDEASQLGSRWCAGSASACPSPTRASTS